MKQYFKDCRTLEDLKRTYRRLAMENHPDRGGSNEVMAIINSQYEQLFEEYKANNNRKAGNCEGFYHTDEKASHYINIINDLMHCEGLTIEICGYWIWLTGNTYTYKDTIKNLGFKYSRTKKAWYYNTINNNVTTYKHRGHFSMAQIRLNYGSEVIESTGSLKLA